MTLSTNGMNPDIKQEPVWTLEQGVLLLRILEAPAIQCGYHTALGGSVLHKGFSNKDLDVFFYLHKSTVPGNRTQLFQLLDLIGFREVVLRDHKVYGDGKEVFNSKWMFKSVDLFFL